MTTDLFWLIVDLITLGPLAVIVSSIVVMGFIAAWLDVEVIVIKTREGWAGD